MLLTNQTWKLETFYHEIAYVVAFMIEPITLFLKKNVTDEYTRAKLKKKKNNSLFTEILLIDAINLHLHFTLIKCIKERLYIKKNITHIQSKFPFFLNNN